MVKIKLIKNDIRYFYIKENNLIYLKEDKDRSQFYTRDLSQICDKSLT